MAAINPLNEHFTVDAFASLVRLAQMEGGGFLLDQEVMTPIGEESVDRILALAQLEASAPVGQLTDPELHRFHRVIRDVLGHVLEGYHGYGA